MTEPKIFLLKNHNKFLKNIIILKFKCLKYRLNLEFNLYKTLYAKQMKKIHLKTIFIPKINKLIKL